MLMLVLLSHMIVSSSGDRDSMEAVSIHVHSSTAMQRQHQDSEPIHAMAQDQHSEWSWGSGKAPAPAPTVAQQRWQHAQKQVRTESHAESRQRSTEEGWQFRDNAYCKKSGTSIALNEDEHGPTAGWGATITSCTELCKAFPECKVFTWGVWTKGYTIGNLFGGHYGDTRCQMYSSCEMSMHAGMTLSQKPLDEDTLAVDTMPEPMGSGSHDTDEVGASQLQPNPVATFSQPALDPDDSSGIGKEEPHATRSTDRSKIDISGIEDEDISHLGPALIHPGRPVTDASSNEPLFPPGSDGDKQDKITKAIMDKVFTDLGAQTDITSSVYKAVNQADKEGKAFHILLGKQKDAALAALGAANIMHKEAKNNTAGMETLLDHFKTSTLHQDEMSRHMRFKESAGEDEDGS